MNDAIRKAASRLASARAITLSSAQAKDHPPAAVMESAKGSYRRAIAVKSRKAEPKRLDPLTDAAVAAAVLLGVYLADRDVPIVQQARDHLMAGLGAVSKP